MPSEADFLVAAGGNMGRGGALLENQAKHALKILSRHQTCILIKRSPHSEIKSYYSRSVKTQ